MNKYQVVVGNLGTVYDGNDAQLAKADYDDFVAMSKRLLGRAGGEPVTLFEDGEPAHEYDGCPP